MRTKAFVVAAAIVTTAAVPVIASRRNAFDAKLSQEKRILHALTRLTFGPRPGDVERVRALGLNRWVERQLHPDRIPESARLDPKLQLLDSLRMSPKEMVEHYPPPQVIRAFADGRMAAPADPERRRMMERLAERYKNRLKPAEMDARARMPAGSLTREQRQALRDGSPEERVEMFYSLGEDQQSALIERMPENARRQLLARAPTELRRKMLGSLAPRELVVHDLVEAKILRAVYSERQLAEVLTDFWYNHFNVYIDKGADRYLVTSYERDAIRPHVLGQFKDMLRATAEHPAMLFYLDNWQSVDPSAARRAGRRPQAKRARGLNENYARELLELHTLGVDGGYTQQDIVEVARCFTGWTIRDPQRGGGFEFNERMHDPGEKTVLGVTIPAGGGVEDGLKVLDILVAHPSTARFVSTKLAQRFVADTPPASLVQKMARTFAKTGGDIREVMKTMLSSGEFWSEGAYRAKVKSPLEIVASAVRALGAEVDFAFGLAQQVGELGQPLYRKQEPTGYPDASEEWVNTAGLLARMNFAQALAANRLPGVRIDAERMAGKDPEQVATGLLLAKPSEHTRAAITKGDAPAPVAGLVLGSPDFQRR